MTRVFSEQIISRALSEIGEHSSVRRRVISDWEKRPKRHEWEKSNRKQATELSHGWIVL